MAEVDDLGLSQASDVIPPVVIGIVEAKWRPAHEITLNLGGAKVLLAYFPRHRRFGLRPA